MNKDQMFAISPLDGRYKEKVSDLSPIFSEFGLMKYRLFVEVEFLKALSLVSVLPRKISQNEIKFLDSLVVNFSDKDFNKIKEFENVTNHDVKAVEYFLKDAMKGNKMSDCAEYVHLGRTSEDINNIAYGFMLREGVQILNKKYQEIQKEISTLADKNKKVSMLALTHGQPASPTTFGWEMNVFASRLRDGLEKLNDFKLKVKLNGATGGDSALYSAYPKINWRKFSADFIKGLNHPSALKGTSPSQGRISGIELTVNPFTTQIESHDTYRELFDIIRGLNLILIDFNQDIWSYISRGVIVQIPKAGEVGSSAMPQKVNPINFENAEGNLGLANALCEFFGRKLTISRMQRDLSDSTVERNFGLVFGHTYSSLCFIQKGLGRIKVDEKEMIEELEKHWEVVSEAYQVILRSVGVKDGYEILKEYTRGKVVDKGAMHAFVDEVSKKHNLSKEIIAKLKKITPENYIGNRSF